MGRRGRFRSIDTSKIIRFFGIIVFVSLLLFFIGNVEPNSFLIIVLFASLFAVTVGLIMSLFLKGKFALITGLLLFFLVLLRAFDMMGVINIVLLGVLGVIMSSLLP